MHRERQLQGNIQTGDEIEVIHRTLEGTRRPGNTQGDQSLVGLFGG